MGLSRVQKVSALTPSSRQYPAGHLASAVLLVLYLCAPRCSLHDELQPACQGHSDVP